MYQVINEGRVVGYCDEPVYVKKKDGVWINCNPEGAEAIAIGGVAIEGAIANEIGTEVYVGDRIAEIEDALCELTMEEEELEEDPGEEEAE